MELLEFEARDGNFIIWHSGSNQLNIEADGEVFSVHLRLEYTDMQDLLDKTKEAVSALRTELEECLYDTYSATKDMYELVEKYNEWDEAYSFCDDTIDLYLEDEDKDKRWHIIHMAAVLENLRTRELWA